MNTHKFRFSDFIAIILLIVSYMTTAMLIHLNHNQLALIALTCNALVIIFCFAVMTYTKKAEIDNADNESIENYNNPDEIKASKKHSSYNENEVPNETEFSDYTVDISSVLDSENASDSTSNDNQESETTLPIANESNTESFFTFNNCSNELINLVEIAKEAVDELVNFALSADIIINTVFENEKIMMVANPSLIKIMFKNVIDNSIKYMNRLGSLNIIISTVDNDIFIVLKDTGEGLSPKETEHVFKLNYQGSNRISGNGLGLTQTKEIVTFYGGTIYAKSDYNKGMGIYIKLPTT